MTQAGFEPAIPASEQPQIHALDRAATGMGTLNIITLIKTTRMEWPEHRVCIKNYKCVKRCSGVSPKGENVGRRIFIT